MTRGHTMYERLKRVLGPKVPTEAYHFILLLATNLTRYLKNNPPYLKI